MCRTKKKTVLHVIIAYRLRRVRKRNYYLSSWGNKSYENKGKTRYPTKFFYAMCFPEGFSRRLRDPKKDFDKEYLRSFVGLIQGKSVRELRKRYGINSQIFREIRRVEK